MSQPVLAISLFFHILATVIWIGSMLTLTLWVIPQLNRILAEQPALYQMLRQHILIVLLALTGVILQFGIAPALERASLLLEHSKGDIKDWRRLRQQEKRLSAVMIGLALLILAASAWLSSI